MIKLCFFSLHMRVGGVERQLYYLLNSLDHSKYFIYLILCKREGEFLKKLSSNINVYDLGIEYSKKKYLQIFFKFAKLLHGIRPNILMSFHIKVNFISCMSRFIGQKNIICCFPGYFNKGRLNCLRCLYLKAAELFIAVSEGVKESLIRNINIKENKISVIENSIDTQDVIKKARVRVNNPFNNSYPIVVSLGRLDKSKGFDIFIMSFQYVMNKCNFLIIGDGPFFSQLQGFAADLAPADRICFVGMKENPYPYLRLSDIFVLASESEGLPTSVLEAMALRKPIICANYVGGTLGVIDHEKNGIIIPCNDPIALASAIDELIESPKKCLALVESAFARVKRNFSVRSYVEKYDNLFKKYEKL